MYNTIIKQIALAGVLSSIAIIVGVFLHFPLFGGKVYLIGAIVFLMPLFLKIEFAFIASSVSVILVDILSGWAAYSWISFLAYGLSLLVIWIFKQMKFKYSYLVGVSIGSILLIGIYYLLERIAFSTSLAFADFLATSIQMLINFSIITMIYFPSKHILKTFLV